MTPRKWNFPISVLVKESGRLHDALVDPEYQADMAERLHAETDTPENNFATRYAAQLDVVRGGGARKAGQTGEASELAADQNEDIAELQRLTAGARRTARLAFPGQDTLLHSEFKVGIDEPKDLASQLERATVIAASCEKRASALKSKGWTPKDTQSLKTVISDLTGTSVDQEDALDSGPGITEERVIAANALYEFSLAIQNAARLEYPSTAGRKDPSKAGFVETARRRFLLEEFPPRDRSNPDGGTNPPPAGPTPPPKP